MFNRELDIPETRRWRRRNCKSNSQNMNRIFFFFFGQGRSSERCRRNRQQQQQPADHHNSSATTAAWLNASLQDAKHTDDLMQDGFPPFPSRCLSDPSLRALDRSCPLSSCLRLVSFLSSFSFLLSCFFPSSLVSSRLITFSFFRFHFYLLSSTCLLSPLSLLFPSFPLSSRISLIYIWISPRHLLIPSRLSPSPPLF